LALEGRRFGLLLNAVSFLIASYDATPTKTRFSKPMFKLFELKVNGILELICSHFNSLK